MTAHAIEISGPPPMEPGAPLPAVLKHGDTLLVSYICRNPAFAGWDSGASPEHPGFDVLCAVLKFSGMTWYHFGAPSDERLHEHPLYGKGLKFYGFHQVEGSERTKGTGLCHWIITFHDETLEVTAQEMKVIADGVRTESPQDAIKRTSERAT